MHALTTSGRRLHALVQQHGPACRGVLAAGATFVTLRATTSGSGGDHADAKPSASSSKLRTLTLHLLTSSCAGAAVAVATRGSCVDIARRAALRRAAAHRGLAELLGSPLVATPVTAAADVSAGARARMLDLGGGLSLPLPWLSARRVRLVLEVTGSGGAAGGRGGAAAGALVSADAFFPAAGSLLFPPGRARFRRLFVDVPCESATYDARPGGVLTLFVEAEAASAAAGGKGMDGGGGGGGRRGRPRAGLAELLDKEEEDGKEDADAPPTKHVEPPSFARITLVGPRVMGGGGGSNVMAAEAEQEGALDAALRVVLSRVRRERAAAAEEEQAERLPEPEAVRAMREAAERIGKSALAGLASVKAVATAAVRSPGGEETKPAVRSPGGEEETKPARGAEDKGAS
jgi:hypothetical protein